MKLKAAILAGGFGTRLIEETVHKPKPMIEIGGKPILWHIMKIYSYYGVDDFIICSGYKGEMIQEYFKNIEESWNVLVIDTGLETMTGGRLKKVKKYLEKETFYFTYGDTLGNINMIEQLNFHYKMKTYATITACHPPEKYGILKLNENIVIDFEEKPVQEDKWINGGYFILEPEVFDYIEGDLTIWENEPMKNLVKDKQLSAYKHSGFYKSMDSLSDKKYLEKLWNEKKALWKV